ncbi:hypothetical protein VSDG_02892 [Cytospora chrysosperma]|uniref:NAD-dependent epimerase/dehydratase domain-containing protein n=1 Tax=Cytospora chrysosperma TaxID=252740 RepID=A0A423WC35_CYTCH|nr:hypothetical protein VSDG_02892 [Valsa sordida]
MSPTPQLRTALVTGANGYIGNAVAKAFVRAGWIVSGLVRSPSAAQALAVEEILPIIGNIDDVSSHDRIRSQLPSTLDTIVSVTEDLGDYVRHYNNIVSLLRTLSEQSVSNGVKPLVIFTSGCKDYGVGPHYANDLDLAPHTEESPIMPPQFATLRAEYSLKFLEHKDAFTPVLVRPTNVHGRSSSFYGVYFDIGEQTAKANKPLIMDCQPDSICHCMHVDDCGDAYVAIASHQRREEVSGQAFNISARRYETVDELGKALVAEYGISQGLKYIDPKDLSPGESPWPPFMLDFPQWTGSDKLRRITGWTDHRPLFTEALHVYRLAYEAAKATGEENIRKTTSFLKALKSEME